MRIEANTLTAELDAIGVERAEGLLTGPSGQDRHRPDQRQAGRDCGTVRPIRNGCGCSTGYRWASREVADAVDKLSPDRFRAVLDVLAKITVAPVGKSGRVFNPQRVQVAWK